MNEVLEIVEKAKIKGAVMLNSSRRSAWSPPLYLLGIDNISHEAPSGRVTSFTQGREIKMRAFGVLIFRAPLHFITAKKRSWTPLHSSGKVQKICFDGDKKSKKTNRNLI